MGLNVSEVCVKFMERSMRYVYGAKFLSGFEWAKDVYSAALDDVNLENATEKNRNSLAAVYLMIIITIKSKNYISLPPIATELT